MVGKALLKDLQLCRRGVPAGHQAHPVAEPRRCITASFPDHSLTEEASSLHKRDIVHQIERLKRRVRASLANDTGFAIRRIEVHHHWWRNGSLPECIQAAA